MKRGSFIILAVLFLFAVLSYGVYAVQTTGSAVDTIGKVTNYPVSAFIYVENAPPTINYLFPKEDRTYRSEDFLINYSVYDPDGISMVFYSLNSGANVSLGNASSNYTYLNLSEGNYSFHFYANDTLGNLSSESFYFFINNTKVIIFYEDFRMNTSGSTTNFDSLSDAQLGNLSNMTLEDTDKGKVVWSEQVNLTNDTDSGDKITALDNNVVLGDNFIFVNSTNLPNLDKEATLWFYSLKFSNPRVLRDGVPCPGDICLNKWYSSGTFMVDVTGFSNYSIQETPEENPGTSIVQGGGGGGEGNKAEAPANFFLDKDNIRVSIKQGETKTDSITIINNGSTNLEINLVPSGIGDFLKVNERDISLKPGETKTIRLDFIAPEDKKPDFYVGKISVISGNTIKEVLVAIEIESKNPLFDVSVEIPQQFQNVFPGQIIMPLIKIYNLGEILNVVDTEVEYKVLDESGKTISMSNETIAVETQASFVKEIKIPSDAKPGNDFVYVVVTYDNQTASSSAKFVVQNPPFIKTNMFIYLLLISILVLLAVMFTIIYFVLLSKSRSRGEKQIDEFLLADKKMIGVKGRDDGRDLVV